MARQTRAGEADKVFQGNGNAELTSCAKHADVWRFYILAAGGGIRTCSNEIRVSKNELGLLEGRHPISTSQSSKTSASAHEKGRENRTSGCQCATLVGTVKTSDYAGALVKQSESDANLCLSFEMELSRLWESPLLVKYLRWWISRAPSQLLEGSSREVRVHVASGSGKLPVEHINAHENLRTIKVENARASWWYKQKRRMIIDGMDVHPKSRRFRLQENPHSTVPTTWSYFVDCLFLDFAREIGCMKRPCETSLKPEAQTNLKESSTASRKRPGNRENLPCKKDQSWLHTCPKYLLEMPFGILLRYYRAESIDQPSGSRVPYDDSDNGFSWTLLSCDSAGTNIHETQCYQ
ncbi:hypothetical protein K438DRAFT_1930782 [Mycena galopus ATCC 62051]|nr:hypothetical protein K438DRAFT_1930782 [Mycena galopus ATCC 62051]